MASSKVFNSDFAAPLPERDPAAAPAPSSTPPADTPDLQGRLNEALAREPEGRIFCVLLFPQLRWLTLADVFPILSGCLGLVESGGD